MLDVSLIGVIWAIRNHLSKPLGEGTGNFVLKFGNIFVIVDVIVVLLNSVSWKSVLEFTGQTFLSNQSATQSARCEGQIDNRKLIIKKIKRLQNKVHVLFSKLAFDNFTAESLSSTFKTLMLFLDR